MSIKMWVVCFNPMIRLFVKFIGTTTDIHINFNDNQIGTTKSDKYIMETWV